ncbi:MAG: MgtC/SapB family protein [Geminicoccaceae bacterium]|nr:MAG: MgtC/SapB family protein [Geminicoccaceae bacterium]
MGYDEVVLRLATALLLGAAIGFERQWRQRMAGLRTNVLVALGAAGYTVFSLLTPDDVSPTRVAAQVVSGIGFLGAGVILRTGVNVQGLNTAATLWCAAAVGVMAGGGYLIEAVVLAAFVVLTNLALRPIVRLINRQSYGASEVDHYYRVRVVCGAKKEAHVRALLLQGVSTSALRLRRLDSEDVGDGSKVEVRADMVSAERSEAVLEQVVGRLSLEASVTAASWTTGDDDPRDAPARQSL